MAPVDYESQLPLKDNQICCLGKRTTTEEGIQRLRQLEIVGLHPVHVAEGGMQLTGVICQHPGADTLAGL